MKLTIFTIISALLLNGAMYWAAQTYKSLFAAEYSFKVAFIFPLLAAILLFLAYCSIRKDEQLIKSLDRLR